MFEKEGEEIDATFGGDFEFTAATASQEAIKATVPAD